MSALALFRAVLVANRGEIACRIMATLRRLGIRSVAVYSDADAGAKHVREADVAEPIGEAPAVASYLNPGAIVGAALRSGVDAVHPGYGFLAESPALGAAVLRAGLAWIGPPPEVLALAGDKVAARRVFEESGFPVLPASGPVISGEEAVRGARSLGFPVMVKPVAGGGGIGMSVARDEGELRRAVESASTRGARFFADPSVYVERFVDGARHVEVQVVFGPDGRGLHLYERECSVQRRYQKIIEEAPSPAVGRDLGNRMCRAALDSMGAIGYVGVGTVECLLTPDAEFFFLEVNARLQVEHAITEMTCGVDLVEEQLRIAAGEGLSFDRTPPRNGHAIEFRVYAEDPRTFLPSPGRITGIHFGHPLEHWQWRLDFGYDAGDEVPMFYDPLIGKVVVHGRDRAQVLDTPVLEHLHIEGVKTNIPALIEVLADERFRSGHYDTGLLAK